METVAYWLARVYRHPEWSGARAPYIRTLRRQLAQTADNRRCALRAMGV